MSKNEHLWKHWNEKSLETQVSEIKGENSPFGHEETKEVEPSCVLIIPTEEAQKNSKSGCGKKKNSKKQRKKNNKS